MNAEALAGLVAAYHPNSAVVTRLRQLNLIMTLGPSGVGKTTLMRASGLPMVLGDASRLPRSREENGVDYWFRSQAEMLVDAQKGRYVQIALGAGGDLKGTHASSFPPNGVATFAVVAAAIETFRQLPFARTETAVVVPPDFDTWQRRLEQHELSATDRQARLQEARQSLEFALRDTKAHFILNDTIEAGTRRLNQLATGEVPDMQPEARSIATNLLQQITTL